MNLDLKKYLSLENLLLISPLFLFITILYIIGFNGLYGQDSHEYYRYSRAIIDFLQTGNSPGDYFWPIYYPVFGAIPGLVIDNLFSLQLISFLSLSGTLFFLLKIMKRIYNEERYFIIYLVVTFLFAPYVFRNSTVVMSDMLAVFLITGSFFYFIKYSTEAKLKQIFLFSLLFSLSVLTRYAAIAVLIIPMIVIIYQIFKKKNFIHLVIPFFTFLLFAIPMLLINQTIISELKDHSWIKGWSVSNFLLSDFVTTEGTQSNRFPNIVSSFSGIYSPTFLVFGLVLAVLAQRNLPKNKYWLICLFVVLAHAFFLSGIPFQNQRYLLLSYPFIVIILFPGFERLTKILNSKVKLLYTIIYVMLTLQIFFCGYFFRSAYDRNLLERNIADYLNSTSHKNIYTFDIDVSFSSYEVHKAVFNLWKEKYDEFLPGSLVIFNEVKFKEQWSGKNPMINWNNLKTNYSLVENRDFGNGWKVYEIK